MSKSITYAQRGYYIDPINCGSLVAYRIYKASYGSLCAHVELTDCNRKIEWDFSGGTAINRKASLDKVDKLLSILVEFRTQLVSAQQYFLEQKRKGKGDASDGSVGGS